MRLFGLAGVPDARTAMMPLVRATAENVDQMGPGAALTGPAVRGDAGTLKRNLEALQAGAPDTVPLYVHMARAAIGLAAGIGNFFAAT